MQQAEFEAELKSAGYIEIEIKTLDWRPVNHSHTHDYDMRGRVLSRVFIENHGDKPVTYRAGDVFNVSAGSSHPEEIGPQGARIVGVLGGLVSNAKSCHIPPCDAAKPLGCLVLTRAKDPFQGAFDEIVRSEVSSKWQDR
jgi:hypothetical protein